MERQLVYECPDHGPFVFAALEVDAVFTAKNCVGLCAVCDREIPIPDGTYRLGALGFIEHTPPA